MLPFFGGKATPTSVLHATPWGKMLPPLRRSKENRSETHPPDKDATLTDGVLLF